MVAATEENTIYGNDTPQSTMNTQAQILKQHSYYIFERIEGTVKDLSEDEATWKPCQDSNDIRWILTHMARIGRILIPQILEGTVKPGGWDDDYERQPHALNELIEDLSKAHEIISEGLDETSDAELGKSLTLWGREIDCKSLLFHLLAELIHHNGQIAMLRGTYKRCKDK
ncbi:MAG: DinB family protein [Candidatus Bathyarchaeota archaeon]|nr:DinB family protein [Candidatus Bathyarchaeota archaeon]